MKKIIFKKNILKKVLKLSVKISLLLVALLFIIYLGFQSNEYVSGNRFVTYLNKNILAVAPIEDSIRLHFDQNFIDNQLFLVGKVHEVATSPIVDVSTFKYLNENMGIITYLAEMDIAQVYYLNAYLKDSTDFELQDILKQWVVLIGQYSTEYRENKWGRLKQYYQQLDSTKQFEVYGIDRLRDFDLLYCLLREKLPVKFTNDIPQERDSLIHWVSVQLPELLETNVFTSKDSLLLFNILYNCQNYGVIQRRDEFMYENLKRYYQQNNWECMKLYGCFGIYHTLQGFDSSFAGRMKKESFLHGGMVSLIESYVNSKLTLPSEVLPWFMADKGAYTKLSYSYDNLLFSYIKGVEDFKRLSQANSISLFKLDAVDSPYFHSNRGLYNFSVLPLLGGLPIDKEKAMTDYAQYLFFINGANGIKAD